MSDLNPGHRELMTFVRNMNPCFPKKKINFQISHISFASLEVLKLFYKEEFQFNKLMKIRIFKKRPQWFLTSFSLRLIICRMFTSDKSYT